MPENKDKKKEPKRKQVGFHLTEGELFELGYDGLNTYFICHSFNNGGWTKRIEIPINEELILIPLNDSVIEKKAVHLPTSPEVYGSDRDLYDLIRYHIHKYVGLSEFYERLATYYVMFTWVFDKFNTLPYLRVIGDYGTGKSRFLKTVGSVCYKPIFAGGANTPAPIFRIIDIYGGTLILDEADFRFSDAEADIVKILNFGYETDIPVLRARTKDKSFDPEPFIVYGPKLLATRKRYTDKALESRCLTEEMDFNWRPDIPSILPETFKDEALEIRNRLLQWRFDKYPHVRLRHDRINESVEPRLNQVIMPLASIIEDQTMLDDLRSFAERYNKLIVVERGMLWEVEVLQAIVNLAQGEVVNTDPTMKEIAAEVNKDRSEKEEHITPHKVGRIIGDGLKLRKINKRGKYHLIWDAAKIKKLCERYGVIVDDDFGGLEDFVDLPIARKTKSTDEPTEPQDEDFAVHQVEKSTKSTSQRGPQKPTPKRCGDCPEYYVEPGWLACGVVDQKVKNLDSCPKGKSW